MWSEGRIYNWASSMRNSHVHEVDEKMTKQTVEWQMLCRGTSRLMVNHIDGQIGSNGFVTFSDENRGFTDTLQTDRQTDRHEWTDDIRLMTTRIHMIYRWTQIDLNNFRTENTLEQRTQGRGMRRWTSRLTTLSDVYMSTTDEGYDKITHHHT